MTRTTTENNNEVDSRYHRRGWRQPTTKWRTLLVAMVGGGHRPYQWFWTCTWYQYQVPTATQVLQTNCH